MLQGAFQIIQRDFRGVTGGLMDVSGGFGGVSGPRGISGAPYTIFHQVMANGVSKALQRV